MLSPACGPHADRLCFIPPPPGIGGACAHQQTCRLHSRHDGAFFSACDVQSVPSGKRITFANTCPNPPPAAFGRIFLKMLVGLSRPERSIFQTVLGFLPFLVSTAFTFTHTVSLVFTLPIFLCLPHFPFRFFSPGPEASCLWAALPAAARLNPASACFCVPIASPKFHVLRY